MFEKLYKRQNEIYEEIKRIFNKEPYELTKEEKRDPRFIELNKEYDKIEMLIQTECF